MAEIILHLPDGTLLHVPEGMDPLAAARQYGDHQAAGAQDRASAVAGGSGLVDDAKTALGAAAHEFNPMTIGTNLLHSIFHPVDTVTGLASAAGNAIAHPIDTVKLLSDPATGGKAIGDLGLLLATGRIPQAVSAVGRALPEGVGVTTAKLARAALEPKKQSIGKLNEIIDASEAGPGVEGLSAREVADLRKQGYSDAMIQKVGAASKGQTPAATLSKATQPLAPKGIPKPDLMSAAQGLDGPKPAFDWPEAGGRYEADASGSHKLIPSADGVPDFLQSELHSGYNNGHVLPEGMAPTERLAQASSGLETPHTGGSTFDVDYGGFLPDVPKFDYEGGVPPSPVSVGEMPAPNPLSRLESAKQSLGAEPAHAGSGPTLSGMPSYTDWAQGMDDVINSASEEDMPNAASSGLARSRPTNAIKDWMSKLQQTNGRGWPFSEIQP